MELKRRKFQGALNILSFNRHFYIAGLCVFILLILTLYALNVYGYIFWCVIGIFLYGLIMPLFVSAYVYDLSKFYSFQWLQLENLNKNLPIKILNINAGFDETSYILKTKFPNSSLKVFDFYNAEQHTEPAIVRARKVSLNYPNTEQISTSLIPLADKSVDLIFLLSSVHEIRSNEEKILFMKECHRVCKTNGTVIMVEHLRDVPNFLAFSIGYTHFFSKHTWLKVFKEAGFPYVTEQKFTPFMSQFICKPS